MRIGVDIRGLLTGKISGIEQYTLQILKQLLAQDPDNTYVLFYVAYKDLGERVSALIAEHDYLRAPNVEIRKLNWVDFPLLLHAFFKPLDWPKADLIAGGLDVMWEPSPMLLPLSARCAKVTTFHDLIFYLYPHTYPLSSRIWQWQMSYPYQARTSDISIAVSYSTKRDMIKLLGTSPGKIEVVHEGVGAEYYEPQPTGLIDELRTRFKLPDKYLYYVGSLEPRKNLATVVKALDQLKRTQGSDIKLVLSGSKSWLTSDLYRLIEELQLQEDIIFTGRVTDPEKMTLLAHALAFVFPTLYEGFGLMVLEAFAAGTPVISSNVSSIPEISGNAAILIDPHDYNLLAKKIIELDNDRELREAMIAAGKARAKIFDWAAAAKQTLAIFKKAKLVHGNQAVLLHQAQSQT